MTKLALTKEEAHNELVSVLKVILDCVDYTEPHGCLLNAPIASILPNEIIMRAKGALERDAELPLEPSQGQTSPLCDKIIDSLIILRDNYKATGEETGDEIWWTVANDVDQVIEDLADGPGYV